MATKPLSMAEFKALGELAKARQTLLVNMFAGTRLKFGMLSSASAGKDILSSAKSVASNARKAAGKGKEAAKSLPGLKEVVQNFIAECADVSGIQDVIEAIGGEVVQELVAEVTPFLGVVYSAGKLAKAAKTVVEDGANLYRHKDWRKGFRPGDPLAAADAIKTIIERELTKHSVELGRQALATGAKLAGLFADLGTGTTAAVGVANALAGLGLKLYALGLDIKDMRAGNAVLEKPSTLSAAVFADCPILGCYLLTCADTSSVANLFVADIGLPGWMDKVEKLKKDKMEPLLKIASKAIDESYLVLDGLQANKGTYVKQGFFASVKSRAVKFVFGKTK
jgi:hypothetical protein